MGHKIMSTKFISEILPISEIEKWKNGNRILITSQTGSGKSQWVKDVLYEYCLQNNKKILLLSNRVLLKNQNEEELLGIKSDVIVLKNYQAMETNILYGNPLSAIISEFDYIVFDEVHYLLSDSAFNSNTDILLSNIKFPIKDKITIFITATPQAVLHYNKQYEYKYTLEQDYSFIEKLYFYSSDNVVENIIANIPLDEKILYFGNALDGFEFSKNIADSQFICSDNNNEFRRKSSKPTMKEIVTKNEFSARILFSTKVLDNGVNIISPSLKHIIIDMSDPIDLIQCLGRKRIIRDEKITLYVKNQSGRDIFPRLQSARNRLKLVDERRELGKEEFQKKYARKPIDNVIMNDGEINWSKFFYSKYLEDVYSKMIKIENAYKKYVCGALLMNVKDSLIAEKYFEKKTLSDILSSYLGKQLYGGIEQEDFKNIFFENVFNLKRKLDVRNRGIISINSILDEDELPFRLVKGRCASGKNRYKRYWIVNKLE